MENKNDYLFKIDRTKSLIKDAIFWYVYFILFILALWFLFINADTSMGKGQYELFIQELSSPRFTGILVITFIVGPISTILGIKKILKNDNYIYFYQEKVVFQQLSIKRDNIIDIRIGCCPLAKENIWIYLLGYGLGGFLTIPLKIFDFLSFYILKFFDKNNLVDLKHNFIIVNTNNQHIVGAIYSQKELENLIKYKGNNYFSFPPSQWECIQQSEQI
jgi:succinate dehydrogenase hydrophobic anchor subunit